MKVIRVESCRGCPHGASSDSKEGVARTVCHAFGQPFRLFFSTDNEIPDWCPLEDDLSDYPGKPPCRECGAMTQEEAELKCICSGDKDHCHGADLWE